MGAMLDQSQVAGWVLCLCELLFVEERKQGKVYVGVFVGGCVGWIFFFLWK